MVGTSLRAKAVSLAGGGSALTTPVVPDVSTQMELLKGEAAVQTSDCGKCLDLSPGAGGRPVCRRCAQVEDLLQQTAELQEAGRRLCNIKEAEKELSGSKCSLQQTCSPRPNSQKHPH